jgi:SAM-dependent methyltransferase
MTQQSKSTPLIEQERQAHLDALKKNPADLVAHNALEAMHARGCYSEWMLINATIHPQDEIFHYFAGHESAGNPFREYLSDGWRSMVELMTILEHVNRPLLKFNSMLEFAAGFGRFTRHLAKALPGKLTCSDVQAESVDFLKKSFGVDGFYSTHDPDTLNFPAQYELVFALSMFTHVPLEMWGPWLKCMYRGVVPGGLLVITIHNEEAAKKMGVQFSERGDHFIGSSESTSLDSAVYGTTFTTTECAITAVQNALKQNILAHEKIAFWTGQDALIIQKP